MSLWVSPSFDDNEEVKPKGQTKLNENANGSAARSKINIPKSIWADKYEPQKKEDLAVNQKKVKEVESWLTSALIGKLGRAPIALFSGPSGSGKTATLKVLAKDMSFGIKEWITPSCTKQGSWGREQYCYEQSSQTKEFEDYLFRASRYSNVFESPDASSCILLVEDVPNVYIHDPSLFEKTLNKFVEIGHSPIVFICSNGSNEFNLERILFKVKLQKDLKISNISFNPISRTLLIKALERILHLKKKENPSVFSNTSNFPIEDVVDSANNDIRFAINQLQFLCCGGEGSTAKSVKAEPSKIPKRIKGKGRKKLNINATTSGKDQSADIFRCLGRVLYCKREDVVDEKTKVVKQRLVHDPDNIVTSMYSVPNLFLGLLHENYLNIFKDIKKISEAGGYLCQSDILMAHWRERDMEIYYSLSLSVHGLMNASSDNIQRKWNPFRGSKSKEAIASYQEKLKTCKDLFPESGHETRTRLTEVFPLLAKIDLPNLQSDQKKFVMSTAEISSGMRAPLPFDEEDNDGVHSICEQRESLPQEPNVIVEKELAAGTSKVEVDEQFTIEEYSSDDGTKGGVDALDENVQLI